MNKGGLQDGQDVRSGQASIEQLRPKIHTCMKMVLDYTAMKNRYIYINTF